MIGDLLVLLVIVIGAGGLGLWFGIVVLAPRLQRRIDRSAVDDADHDAAAPAISDKEPDGRAH